MCSHRIRAAKRMASVRRAGRPLAEGGVSGVLPGRSLSPILDGSRLDLDITLEFLGEWRVGERHLLANALIRPVLPRGVDGDGVLAGGERPAAIVLAVPEDLVLAGGARRPRDRVDHAGLVDFPPDPIGAIPALQVGEPLERPGTPGRDPELQVADGESLLVLGPDGHVRAAVPPPFDLGAVDLELDEQLELAPPGGPGSGLRLTLPLLRL